MSDDFPAFALSEEHEALREAVRALADDKIAPRAAEIDRTSEFPWDVYEALVKADFHALHIPEATAAPAATPWRPRSSSRKWRGPAPPRH